MIFMMHILSTEKGRYARKTQRRGCLGSGEQRTQDEEAIHREM